MTSAYIYIFDPTIPTKLGGYQLIARVECEMTIGVALTPLYVYQGVSGEVLPEFEKDVATIIPYSRLKKCQVTWYDTLDKAIEEHFDLLL